jgi:hypothetical protein
MVELITILLISLNPCFQGFGRIGMNFSKAPYKRYAILTNIYIGTQKREKPKAPQGSLRQENNSFQSGQIENEIKDT